MQSQCPRLALQQGRGSGEREVLQKLEKWNFSVSWVLEMKRVHFSCPAVSEPGYLDKASEVCTAQNQWDRHCHGQTEESCLWVVTAHPGSPNPSCNLRAVWSNYFIRFVWESSRSCHLWMFPGENEWVLKSHHVKFKVTHSSCTVALVFNQPGSNVAYQKL